MLNMKTYIAMVVIFFLLVISYSVYYLFDDEMLLFWLKEDGVVETIGAIMFLMASSILIYLYFRSKEGNNFIVFKTKRNLFFLLLGILFFFIFGEEISWGQRIFNIETPEKIAQINQQKELNVHNLFFFHGLDAQGVRKEGISLWYNMDRLFSVFWFLYCFIMPIFNIISKKISNFFKTLNIPIVPLWIGSLFVVNYILSKATEKLVVFSELQVRSPEIKETNLGLLFFIVALSFYFNFKKHQVLNKN